jgi:hypothetical protein
MILDEPTRPVGFDLMKEPLVACDSFRRNSVLIPLSLAARRRWEETLLSHLTDCFLMLAAMPFAKMLHTIGTE